jgi:hypothetical protein
MVPSVAPMEQPMPAMPLSSTLRGRPAGTLAALGLVSGLLSAAWGQTYDLEVLQPLAMVFLLAPGALAIGAFYGATLGVGMAAWTRTPWAGIIVLVTTMYAWSAAIHTAVRLQDNTGGDAYLVAASLCAGAVGAGLTHLGCALVAYGSHRTWRIRDLVTITLAVIKSVARELRWRLALTCAVGAALGMLFYLGERKIIDERLLYLVWQPAVAFCIGLGLPRQSQDD